MTVTTDAAGLDLSRFLRPHDRIVWGQACGEPTTVVEALIAQAQGIGPLSAFAATLDVAAPEKVSAPSRQHTGWASCPVM